MEKSAIVANITEEGDLLSDDIAIIADILENITTGLVNNTEVGGVIIHILVQHTIFLNHSSTGL